MCSVALGRDGECIDQLELNEGYSHAEKLAPFVDELLNKHRLPAVALDAIAVSKGPGSYTGLRIGVSLAKGLCYALSKPLIAVPTLQIMCLHPAVRKELNLRKNLLLCPMLDARRMEVYTAVYDIGLQFLEEVSAKVLDEQSYAEYLKKEGMLFFGPGSDKFKEVVKSENAYFADDVWPSAREMCGFAETKFQASDVEDVAYFEPFYLKEFMATTPKKLLR